MSNDVNLLKYIPIKYHNSDLLTEFIDVIGPELSTIASADKLYNVSNWLDLIDDLQDFFDPNVATAANLRHLAQLIGFGLLPSDNAEDSILRSSVLQAVDWYKVKGTYQSLKIIALINDLTFNIYDMYTDSEYSTFNMVDWFVGGENENPSGYDYPTYFKSPHFGIEILLNHVYDPNTSLSASYPYLWHYSYLDNVQRYVEKTRPVHTVPHYLLLLSPVTVENGTVVVTTGDIQTASTLNWISGLRYFDQNASYDSTYGDTIADWTFDEKDSAGDPAITFDETSGITVDYIDKWRLATGNKTASLEIDEDLIARWKLNDAADSLSVEDYSGNGNTGTAQQNTNLMHDLRAWWLLNEETGAASVVDTSGGGNNGTSVPGTVTSTIGKVGSAISFDGATEYITVDANDSDDEWYFGTNDFSICFWVKFDSLSGAQTIVGLNGNADNYWTVHKDTNNYLRFVSRVGGTLQASYFYSVNSIISADTWYHIIIGRNGTTALLYINGVEYAMNEIEPFSTNSVNFDPSGIGSVVLALGAAYFDTVPVGPDQLTDFFEGALSDVRIFKKALSDSDATYLYNSGNGTSLALPEGVVGNALTFNGTDDYVDCGDVSAIEGIEALSFSVWVYRSSSSAGTVFRKSGPILLDISVVGKVRFGIYTTEWKYIYGSTSYLVPIDTWTHLSGTYDGTHLNLYINGVQQTEVTHGAPGATSASADSFKIGCTTGENYFAGKIDDLRLYDILLTPDEISDIYELTSTSDMYSSEYVPYAIPEGHWKMDDSSTTAVTDESYNGNDGVASASTSDMSVTGKVDTGIEFNGTDEYVEVADDAALNFGTSTDFSLAFWCKVDAESDYQMVFSKRESGANAGYEFYIAGSGHASYPNRGMFLIISDISTYTYLFTDSAIADNAWHHIMVSLDRDGYGSLYVDGDLQSAGYKDISSVGDIDNSDPLYFGARNGSNYFYDGILDDIRLYNQALSSSYAEYFYNDGNGVKEYTGDIDSEDVTVYNDRVEVEFLVPSATDLDGVSELNVFTYGDTSNEEEVITSLFSDIHKSTESQLRVLITINRE